MSGKKIHVTDELADELDEIRDRYDQVTTYQEALELWADPPSWKEALEHLEAFVELADDGANFKDELALYSYFESMVRRVHQGKLDAAEVLEGLQEVDAEAGPAPLDAELDLVDDRTVLDED